jgi:DNA-binding NtrC family response regulator
VLVVDDDAKVAQLMVSTIEREGAMVKTAASGEEALEIVTNSEYDLMLADVKMPGMDGIELMHRLKERNRDMETIIITAYGDIELAVKAIKEGAYDFITKPFHLSQIVAAAERAIEKKAMACEIKELRSHAKGIDRFESMVGGTLVMREVYERIAQVAPTESTVLVQGETGTGKELAAHAIHARSYRASGPFIVVNCATLSESLLESELFGHLKGAFTGALSAKIGLFEAATGGTILLDEIDSTSQQMQLSLLRVLEDKQVRPVGSVSRKPVDIRVIASAQRDLFKLSKQGQFREDLYYRISAITITLPPLRERTEDVPLLAEHFLRKFSKKAGKQPRRFSDKSIDALMNYHWPGNVREVENVIKQAVLFSQKPVIDQSDLGIFIQNGKALQEEQAVRKLDDIEREHILRVLIHTRNNKLQTARILGIPRSTLYEKMRKHHISSDTIREEPLQHNDMP